MHSKISFPSLLHTFSLCLESLPHLANPACPWSPDWGSPCVKVFPHPIWADTPTHSLSPFQARWAAAVWPSEPLRQGEAGERSLSLPWQDSHCKSAWFNTVVLSLQWAQGSLEVFSLQCCDSKRVEWTQCTAIRYWSIGVCLYSQWVCAPGGIVCSLEK